MYIYCLIFKIDCFFDFFVCECVFVDGFTFVSDVFVSYFEYCMRFCIYVCVNLLHMMQYLMHN